MHILLLSIVICPKVYHKSETLKSEDPHTISAWRLGEDCSEWVQENTGKMVYPEQRTMVDVAEALRTSRSCVEPEHVEVEASGFVSWGRGADVAATRDTISPNCFPRISTGLVGPRRVLQRR